MINKTRTTSISKVIAFCIILLVLFIAGLYWKVNFSSVAIWDEQIFKSESSPLLLGQPKSIRSDEWAIHTPLILSQYRNDFPVRNYNAGEGVSPLLSFLLPAKHFSTFFRPQNWGYFLFDIERGFSYAYLYKALGLVFSTFLVMMIITKNCFYLSLFASIWLLFSSNIQWWFSNSTIETIISANFVFASLVYLLSSANLVVLIISALLLIINFLNVIFIFYPPAQISLAYVYLFMFIGYLIQNFDKQAFLQKFSLRISILFICFIAILIFDYFFYKNVRETIQMIMATTYPGERLATGGTETIAKYFSGFMGSLYSETDYPMAYHGPCSASSFLFLWPLALFLLIKEKKQDIVSYFLLFSILFLSYWYLFGMPQIIAKYTLLMLIPPERALPAIGFASIAFVVRFLSLSNDNNLFHSKNKLILFCFILLIALAINAMLLMNLIFYLPIYSYIAFSLLLALICFYFLTNSVVLFCTATLIFVVMPSLPVNTITLGLGNLYSSGDRESLVNNYIGKNDYWVVYGENSPLASYVMASGMRVFNGIKYPPSLREFGILDLNGENIDKYNRYAYFFLNEKTDEKIDFKLRGLYEVTISINPCSKELSDIGITHFAFDKKISEKEYGCLKLSEQQPKSGRFWVYIKNAS